MKKQVKLRKNNIWYGKNDQVRWSSQFFKIYKKKGSQLSWQYLHNRSEPQNILLIKIFVCLIKSGWIKYPIRLGLQRLRASFPLGARNRKIIPSLNFHSIWGGNFYKALKEIQVRICPPFLISYTKETILFFLVFFIILSLYPYWIIVLVLNEK